jgi:hypothetical protein
MKRVLLAVLLTFGASATAAAQVFYFPQVAAGGFEGGLWQTTIFLSNTKGDVASGTITLTGDDGGPLEAAWIDESGAAVSRGNTIPFQLGPNQSRKFISVEHSPLRTGYATVTSNSSWVLGNAMFTLFDAGGRMLAEAGVPMAIPLGKQAIFVDTTGGFITGVAIANPNAATLNINFELVSNTGKTIMTEARQLPPFQHVSFFVHELFPAAGPMVGRLQFYCMNPMVSVGLRLESSFVPFTSLSPLAMQ